MRIVDDLEVDDDDDEGVDDVGKCEGNLLVGVSVGGAVDLNLLLEVKAVVEKASTVQ
jgi:hypothetical protein